MTDESVRPVYRGVLIERVPLYMGSDCYVHSNYGDPEQCRKILHRAVNSASDDPEVVIETLLQFEREEGDLESYEASLEKCASQLKRLAERTERVNA